MKVVRKIRRGLIRVAGTAYHCTELAVFEGRNVFVEKHDDYVDITAMDGRFICRAQRDVLTEK